MRMIKVIKWLAFSLFSATVLYFSAEPFFSKDEQYRAVEEFVRNDSQVRAAVGTISSVKLRRYLSVQASDVSGAYRTYNFYVRGDKSKVEVSIRAVAQGANTYRYTVDSLEGY